MRCRQFLAFAILAGASNTPFLAQHPPQLSPIYFPPKVFADLKQSRYANGKMQEIWFGSQLSGLREPPLIKRFRNDEPVYRLTLLPSFSHPIAIRVTIHPGGTATVVTRVGKGAGGYAPKGLLSDQSAELSSEKVQALKNAVALSKFWGLPTEPNRQSGTDGTEWLFEAAESGRYHVVDRWEGADLRKLGLFFLNDIGHVGPEANLPSAIQ
jgi:hypothetical protein